MKFKPGDVCEIVGYVFSPRHVGRQCTLIDGPRDCRPKNRPGVIVYGFQCEVDGETGLFTIDIRHLRLKRPPAWDKWIFDTEPVKHDPEMAQWWMDEVDAENAARLRELRRAFQVPRHMLPNLYIHRSTTPRWQWR